MHVVDVFYLLKLPVITFIHPAAYTFTFQLVWGRCSHNSLTEGQSVSNCLEKFLDM